MRLILMTRTLKVACSFTGGTIKRRGKGEKKPGSLADRRALNFENQRVLPLRRSEIPACAERPGGDVVAEFERAAEGNLIVQEIVAGDFEGNFAA
jgi:hypothetical protein